MKLTVKVMQNGLGQWAVFYGTDGKATKLAYKRFFKTQDTAQVWANKFIGTLQLN